MAPTTRPSRANQASTSPFKPIPIKTQKLLNSEHKVPIPLAWVVSWLTLPQCPKWSSCGICVRSTHLFCRICADSHYTPFTRCWPADCSSRDPCRTPDAGIDPDFSARPACPLARRRSRPYWSTPLLPRRLAPPVNPRTMIPRPRPPAADLRSELFSPFPSQAPGATMMIIVVSSSDAAQRSAAHSCLR
ncbi:hypothetical protein B0H14DRAFT_2696000 [Mycena olivaceomarginata]|nr:hypothetical protein B0H14DRAFT_2696000 [Mycena olivaceomarginata]